MFLAKKRIAIAREDGIEVGREEGRAEERAVLAPRIAELTSTVERMQEEIRQLRNGRSGADLAG